VEGAASGACPERTRRVQPSAVNSLASLSSHTSGFSPTLSSRAEHERPKDGPAESRDLLFCRPPARRRDEPATPERPYENLSAEAKDRALSEVKAMRDAPTVVILACWRMKWRPSSQVHVISTHRPRVPASKPDFQRFSFALCLFYHFPGPCHKPIPSSHLPPTYYSFKVVFRVFRDFHSVPVKPLLCSSWNIRAVCSRSNALATIT
jgi:hypothetical protein